MHTLTDFMTGEHAQCDALFARAEQAVIMAKWDEALIAYREFERASTRHLEFEEHYLFSAFDATRDMVAGPTDIMRREHLQLRHLMQAMHSALVECDRTTFYAHADLYRVMNHQHNRKEEYILYPLADRTLGPRGSQLLENALYISERAADEHVEAHLS